MGVLLDPKTNLLRLVAFPAKQSKPGKTGCNKKDRRRLGNPRDCPRVNSDQTLAIGRGDDLRARAGGVDGVSIAVINLRNAVENGAGAVSRKSAFHAVVCGCQIQREGVQDCVPLSGFAGCAAGDVAGARGDVYATPGVDVGDQGGLFPCRQVIATEKNRRVVF